MAAARNAGSRFCLIRSPLGDFLRLIVHRIKERLGRFDRANTYPIEKIIMIKMMMMMIHTQIDVNGGTGGDCDDTSIKLD